MITEQQVLRALADPKTVKELRVALDIPPDHWKAPVIKELDEVLMSLRTRGVLKFNIQSGKWSKTNA